MADDLFSKLFELFNQPGPVNLRLAGEVAHHLVGERQPIDPWGAEELRELTRLAEFRVEQVAPFAVTPAPDVLPVDAREWADRSLEGFRYLAEPFAGVVDLSALGPGAAVLGNLGPALVGMQLGTLVGSLANWVMASSDAGVPVEGNGPITYVVPTMDRFAAEHGFDARDVRLWTALHETAHRAMFRVPFTNDQLVERLTDFAATMRVEPDRLMEMVQNVDPASPGGGLDPEAIAALFTGPETVAAQAELECLLGLTSGYRRLLVARAAGSLLPRLAEMESARDEERTLGEQIDTSAFAATFAAPDVIEQGAGFCLEVERRFGEESLRSLWTGPGRFPTAAERDDPTAWAARVLLEDL